MSSRSAVASESPGTDREIAALADQFQQLRPEVLNTLSESLSEEILELKLNKDTRQIWIRGACFRARRKISRFQEPSGALQQRRGIPT